MDIDARITHPTGTTYAVQVDQPMVEEPLGRHGTWWGVALNRWHHGRSGIGTKNLPPIHSEVAAFGLGTISADGRILATGVPVHVMTAEQGIPGRLELDVGDEKTLIHGLPDGHLRVVWADYGGGTSRTPVRTRNAVGTATLVGLLALAFAAVRREEFLVHA